MKIPDNMKDSTKEGLKKIIVDMITESEIKNIGFKGADADALDIVITINPTD